jgi:hypothetical protein
LELLDENAGHKARTLPMQANIPRFIDCNNKMVEAAGLVISSFRAVYQRIDDMRTRGPLANGLRQRLQSLESPINMFTQRRVTDPRTVTRLVNHLQGLGEFLDEIQNRCCCCRLLCSKSDVVILDRFEQQVTGCVADFHLMISMQEIVNSENRQESPLTAAQTVEVIENREALRSLSTQEARDFYNRHYNGRTEISWEAFWHNFEDVLDQSNIPISIFLKDNIRTYCDVDRSGQISVQKLNHFFIEWRKRKDEIVRQAADDQRISSFLDDYQFPYTTILQIRLKYVEQLYRLPLYKDSEIITITSKGLPNQPPTRIIRFGKGDPSRNHISFNPDDPGLERDMFQIYANRDGYYIIDAYNSGNCNIRLKKGDTTVLNRGNIVLLGNTTLHVLQASETMLQIRVYNGEAELLGRTLDFSKRPSDTLEVSIGKSRTNKISFESDERMSRVHAKISFKYGAWTITDNNSVNGTWLNLMNLFNQELNKPSPPRKLKAEEVIGTELYRFEVLSV